MKKTSVVIIILILALPTIYAITETKENLNINSVVTVNGKTLTILRAAADGNIKVDVDGKKGIVQYGGMITEVNGMKMAMTNYTYIDETYAVISMGITVDAPCGNGVCEANMSETNETCCTDCGCTTGTCIKNICTIVMCKEDKDCDDKNNCTIDKCTDMKKCSNTKIEECKSGDGCCPSGCRYENDTDCEKEVEPLGECKNDTDCNDNNSCTIDKCEGKPTKCTHQTTEGCDFNGKCYNITERTDKVYCTLGGMKQQKENKAKCNNNYECIKNVCIKNACGKEPKTGIYIGIVVAVLTFLALMFMGHSIFRKKEQDLKPNKSSDNT